jgi:hypothetical protein
MSTPIHFAQHFRAFFDREKTPPQVPERKLAEDATYTAHLLKKFFSVLRIWIDARINSDQ